MRKCSNSGLETGRNDKPKNYSWEQNEKPKTLDKIENN